MADDAFWQAFATKNAVALLACRFTDKPHEQPFIEDYVNVSRGSGQALLDVTATFASRSNHPGSRLRATLPVGHVGGRAVQL
jgi:hypothetical protein